ncbi:GNAT family N-acetyltransferase [Pseudohalocynthiibacter sp. F2068]|jgi:L-ornithine Nalpha-acyltransferase|uniref:GNAT family N-acetyltransferase n=1 Tax=Pseudohalocynthiibacter sp. F2068 TaxID=2926418 RepID=UPI001FF0F5A5|nr:GNAT family N-acetyltransferase [Pseudohalocynthiibacter sp. F2068]MCK0100843.1 GNAT family N-acetyltransferase [Pseudohalocynthiibacter sp. F2068]
MATIDKARFTARLAVSAQDVRDAQSLRHLAFIEGTGAPMRVGGLEQDKFDDRCRHVLIEETATGKLVCCFRLLPLKDGSEIDKSYSAQFYELSALRVFTRPMTELGRFCIHPDISDPDILRVAWAVLTRFVDDEGVEMLFGCSSFKGTAAENYNDAFALLRERHLAPKCWRPKVKAPNVFQFAKRLRRKPDANRALLGMPPLLRSYLAMGGWVSDHAVVDRDMNTLHVFTGLEIQAISPARKRLLRAVAAQDVNKTACSG